MAITRNHKQTLLINTKPDRPTNLMDKKKIFRSEMAKRKLICYKEMKKEN